MTSTGKTIKDADGRYEVNLGGIVIPADQDDPLKAVKRNASSRTFGFDGDEFDVATRINGGPWRINTSGVMRAEPGLMGDVYVKVRNEADVKEPVISVEPV